ncbi:MAG: O-antigen ligase family protein [Chloroflexi bacterium]|nr:O-antigen ligase family protein [Chloroflexota bacterium]
MSQSSQPLSAASTPTAVREKSVNRQIFRALLSLASAVLLIRLMGTANQIIITSRFGAGATMDAYFVAYSLPYLLAQLIINVIEYSVIPVYARVRSNREQKSALFSTLLNVLLIGCVLLIGLMFIFRRQMIFLSAPALDAFRTGLAVDLAPFMLVLLLLMVVIGLLESILNAEGQFGWPAYAGLLVPLAAAVLVLTAGKPYGVVVLCIGMIIGSCLQLGVIILRAKRAKLVYRPTLNLRSEEIGLIVIAAGPALLGTLITQVSPVVDQIFASFLSAGSISALNYSLKITSVIAAIIFGSVARALLPFLSRQASANDTHAFKETLRLYLWIVIIGTTLLAVFIFVLAHPLVQILFQRGAFTAADTSRTAVTLMGFAVGLTPMAFGFIASRALSALRKNHMLLYVTGFSVVANAVFDYIFARIWQSEGIALATSAVYFCTMFILLFMLRRTLGKLHLFAPPREVQMVMLAAMRKLGIEQDRSQGTTGNRKILSLPAIFYNLRRPIVRTGIIISVFAAGITGIFLDSLYTLRISLGSIVILALLRYRYALLLAWVVLLVLTGFSASLAGNNILTGLVAPTLLLMFCMPVKQTFKLMPALACLFIYLLWAFAGIGISPIGVGAFLTHWTIFMAYVGIGILTINVITTRRYALGLIDVMLLMGLLVALYGIYGYFTRQNGISSPDVGFRIISIFKSSPSLALFLSLVIPLALYRALISQGFKRVGHSIVFLILLAALVLTFTRSAFISVPLSIIIMILLQPSRKIKIGLLSAFLVLVVLVILLASVDNLPLFSRFLNQDITSLNGRTYIWQALLDHFDPTQLLGKGLDASDVLLTNLQVSASNQGVIATAPHSLFLEALYDDGIIGASLLSLIFIVLFASLLAKMRKASGEQRMLFATALAVLISVFLQSLTSSDLWIENFSVYFWIIMTLPFASCWYASKRLVESDEEVLDDDEETVPRMQAISRAERELLAHV